LSGGGHRRRISCIAFVRVLALPRPDVTAEVIDEVPCVFSRKSETLRFRDFKIADSPLFFPIG
jgi:hypothetical protein